MEGLANRIPWVPIDSLHTAIKQLRFYTKVKRANMSTSWSYTKDLPKTNGMLEHNQNLDVNLLLLTSGVKLEQATR